MSSGFIPNYALFSPGAATVLDSNPQYSGAVAKAVSRERSFGVTPKVVKAPTLKSHTNPGLAVVNQEQEGGRLSNARILHGGLDPKQGASEGHVPNFAIGPMKYSSITSRSQQNVESIGLKSAQAIDAAARSIFNFSSATGPLKNEMIDAANSFGKTARGAAEASVRMKALDGTLKSVSDRKLFRQLSRSDIASGLTSDKNYGTLASSLMSGGKLDEEKLRSQINFAKQSNTKESKLALKQLQKFDKLLDSQAKQASNLPKNIGQQLAIATKSQAGAEARIARFQDTGGYNRSSMRRELAQAFLASRNVPGAGDMTKDQSSKALSSFFSAGGASARNAFNQFANAEGVKSSVSSLAKAGFGKGELAGLTTGKDSQGRAINNNAKNFITAMNALERRVASGSSTKSINQATRVALKEAAKATTGLGSQPLSRLTSSVSDLVREQKRVNATDRAQIKSDARANKISGLQGQGKFFRASFLQGLSGTNMGGTGGRLGKFGNLAGRGAAATGSSLKGFASGIKGFGGTAGLTASFVLPMLAGMIGPKKSRIDRAEFDSESGSFRIAEGLGREQASSTMMGAGIGALFGLPGMIAGAGIGYITSLNKMSLSIEEVVKLRDKEISTLNQNINAISKLGQLSDSRAAAMGSGDSVSVEQIDTAMNAALASLTSADVLKDVLGQSGSKKGLAKIQQRLQDELSASVSSQNFASALSRGGQLGTQNAGVSLANILTQGARSGNVKGGFEGLQKTLNEVRKDLDRESASRTAPSEEELRRLRSQASGNQSYASSGTLSGAGMGLGVASIPLIIAALAGAPLSGGMSLGLLAAGGVGGAIFGRNEETGEANAELKRLRESSVGAYGALQKLADSGAMSQDQLEYLTAAYNASEISWNELLSEVDKNVKSFQTLNERQNALSQVTFNLERSFQDAIASLVKTNEIDSIKTKSSIKSRSSISEFAAGFSNPGIDQQQNLSRKRLGFFEEGIGLKLRDFNNKESIGLLREIRKGLEGFNLNPVEVSSLVKGVQDNGITDFQDAVGAGQISSTFNPFGGRDRAGRGVLFDNIKQLRDELGPMKGDEREMQIQKIGNLVGLQSQSDIANFLSKLNLGGAKEAETRDKVRAGEESFMKTLDVSPVRQLSENEKNSLERILKQQQDRADILDEMIAAERKAKQLQEAENVAKAAVNQKIRSLQSRVLQGEIATSGATANQMERSQRSIRSLQFQGSDSFRGAKTDKQERERQLNIQKQIFEEERKSRTAEVAGRIKSEMLKLASDERLVRSINDLSTNIEKVVNSVTGQNSQTSATSPLNMTNQVTTPSQGKRILKSYTEEQVKQKAILEDKIKKEKKALDTAIELKNQAKNSRSIYQELTLDIDDFKIKSGAMRGQFRKNKNSKQSAVQTSELESQIRQVLTESKSLETFYDKFIQELQGVKEGDVIRKVDLFEQTLKDVRQVSAGNMNEAIADIDKANDQINTAQANIDKTKNELQDILKQTPEVKQATSDFTKSFKALSGVGIKASEDFLERIINMPPDPKIIDQYSKELDSLATQLSASDVEAGNAINTARASFSNLVDRLRASITDINLQETHSSIEAYIQNIEGLSEMEGSMRGIRETSRFKGNTRGEQNMAGGNIALKAFGQQYKDRANVDFMMNNRNLFTDAEIGDAKVQAYSTSFGSKETAQEISDLISSINALKDELKRLEEKQSENATDDRAKQIEDTKKQIEGSTAKAGRLARQGFNRTTARDGGIINELRTNIPMGLESGFGNLQKESEQIYTRLGQDLPFAFRNGLVDAMQAALSGADNLRDKLKDIGISFLQMIQKAFLQSAASRITGAIGGAFDLKLNRGGAVTGGSGIKDDIPAMLTGGEYVIKKSSVNKYGMGFMNSVNSGSLPGYAEGGAVDFNIKGPKAAKRKSYQDKNKYGNVTRYNKISDEIGIDSRLTGFARANDRKIQEYFRGTEEIFRQDLETKEQEKNRKETRERIKKEQKNALIGAIAGIAGGILISKTMDWYKGTNFAKNRASKKQDKQFRKDFDKSGNYTYKGGRDRFEVNPTERRGIQKDAAYFKSQGWDATQMNSYMQSSNVNYKLTGNNNDWDLNFNKGGKVPTMLTGGEYIMSPEAVKSHGSAMMSSINNGTYSPKANQSSMSSPTGDVNISINVSSDGSTQEAGDPLKSKEFATKVKSAVMDVIHQEKRVGGKLR